MLSIRKFCLRLETYWVWEWKQSTFWCPWPIGDRTNCSLDAEPVNLPSPNHSKKLPRTTSNPYDTFLIWHKDYLLQVWHLQKDLILSKKKGICQVQTTARNATNTFDTIMLSKSSMKTISCKFGIRRTWQKDIGILIPNIVNALTWVLERQRHFQWLFGFKFGSHATSWVLLNLLEQHKHLATHHWICGQIWGQLGGNFSAEEVTGWLRQE